MGGKIINGNEKGSILHVRRLRCGCPEGIVSEDVMFRIHTVYVYVFVIFPAYAICLLHFEPICYTSVIFPSYMMCISLTSSLYWVDTWKAAIYSIDYEGNDQKLY